MASPHFHPQRLHPRYGGLVNVASQLPGGLATVCTTLAPFIFDQQPAGSENPTSADLQAAVVAVCGFPRTSTTFLQDATGQVIGGAEKCWKNHDPFSIPGYIKAGLLTIIPLRDPINTISSWSLYNNDPPSISRKRSRLLAYTAWHRAVRKYAKSPRVLFVSFDSLGAASERFVAGVRQNNEAQLLPLAMQTFPSEAREKFKEPYLEILTSPILRRQVADANGVYENLMRVAVAFSDVEVAAVAAVAVAVAVAAA